MIILELAAAAAAVVLVPETHAAAQGRSSRGRLLLGLLLLRLNLVV